MIDNKFCSKIKFYDDIHFPYQFSRSGDFTIREAEVLTNYGYVMNLLETGKLKPESEEQLHFLKVIAGKHKPLYLHEQVYLKYLNLIKKKDSILKYVVQSKPVNIENLVPEDD